MKVKLLRISFFYLAALVLLSGCGSVADPTDWFGEESTAKEPAELVDVKNAISPKVLWSRDVGAGTDELSLNLRPKISGQRIYVADNEGVVQALDVNNGKTIWSVETELPISGGPGYGGDLVIVGTTDADVLALDADTGEERWRKRVTSEVLSTPVAALGVIVVHTLDGKLFGLNANDGSERWRYERTIPVLTLRGSGSPVVNGTTVYCGFAGGKLVAFEIDTGVPLWDINVTVPSGRSELERLSDIDGDPLVYDGTVYAVTFQGEVAAIGEARGSLLWRRKISSYSGLVADWTHLFISDDVGNLWAIDNNNGAARWRQEILANRKLSAPAVLGQYVIVGDLEGYLHWFSANDGRLVARTRAGSGRISAPPQVVDGVLYVLGDEGDLYAISLPTSDS